MKNKLFIFLIIFHLILITGPGYSQEFEMPSFVHAIDACDMDMDGSNDIIVSCGYIDTIAILFNDGYGNFEPYYYGRTTGYLLCGCIDGDSVPDIVTTTNNLNFIKNNGDRTLVNESVVLINDINFPMNRIIDMNNDGWSDIIYDLNTYWGIFKNNGDLTFTNVLLESDGGPSRPSIGYFNDDSLPDIVISYDSQSKSQVTEYLINNGNFEFSISTLNNIQYLSPLASELNNLFPTDLSLFYTPTNEVHLYENTGNSVFQLKNIYLINNSAGVEFEDRADYNQDGYDDFSYIQCFWTGCTDSMYVELNNQNWSFLPAQQYYIGTLHSFIINSIDLNGDCFPDFYMTGYNSNKKIKILWNNGDGNFSYENPVKIAEIAHIYCNFNIFPNPFVNNLTIELNTNLPVEYSIFVRNIYGQILKSFYVKGIESKSNNKIIWDGKDNNQSACSPGIYLVTIKSNSGQISKKVIKY